MGGSYPPPSVGSAPIATVGGGPGQKRPGLAF